MSTNAAEVRALTVAERRLYREARAAGSSHESALWWALTLGETRPSRDLEPA